MQMLLLLQQKGGEGLFFFFFPVSIPLAAVVLVWLLCIKCAPDID